MSTTPGAKASSSSPSSSSFRPSAAVRRSGTLSSRKKRKASPLTKTAQWRQAQTQAKDAHASEQVDDNDGRSISLNDNDHDTDDDHNHNGFLTWTYAENKRLLQWLTVWQEDGLDWDKISASLMDRTSEETHEHWKRCDAEYCSLLAKRYGIHADAIRLVSRQWMVRRKQQSQDGKKHYWKIPYRTHNSQDYDRAFISRLDPNVDQTELLRVMNQVSKREAEEWANNVAATSTINDDDDFENIPIPDGLASSPPRRRRSPKPPRNAPDSSSPKPPSTSTPSIRQLLKEGRVRTIKVELIENDEEEQAEEAAAISGTTEEEVGASEMQSDGMDNQQGDDEHTNDEPTANTQPQTATNESSVSEKPDEAHENDKEGDTDTVSKTSLPISFRISGKGIRLQASGTQKRGLNSLPNVILDDDCQLLSDYGITIMDQYVSCKSPKLADFVKLDPVQGSTYGLVCRHCMDIDREEGRFNPLSASHLISMWSDMEKHSETCKELPLEVKEGMFACAHSDEAQTRELPEGSRDQYLERLWQRLEPLQAPEEQPAKLAQDELDEQREMRGGESDSDESRLGTHGQNELLEVITEVDKQKLPESLCAVMANVGACWAEEKDAERHTELGIKVGFPGLLCNFCKGVGRKREGRHFFLEKESLRDAEELFRNHFKVCKKTPTKVKREITAALKKKQENTTSAVRKKNNYYGRLWNKLETMRIFDEEDCEIDESESEGEDQSSESEGASVDSEDGDTEDGDTEDGDSEDEDEASESQTPRVTQDTSNDEEQGSDTENEESDQEGSEDDADEKSEESPKEVRPKRRGRPKKANNSNPKRGRPGKKAVENAKSAQKPITKARKRGRPRKVAEPVSDERDDGGDASSEEEDSKTDAKTKNGMTDLDFPDSDQEQEKPQRKSPRSKHSPKTREDSHPSRRSKRLRKRREKPLMVAFMAQKWKKKAKRS